MGISHKDGRIDKTKPGVSVGFDLGGAVVISGGATEIRQPGWVREGSPLPLGGFGGPPPRKFCNLVTK